jgi:hypothetical protein
VGNYFIEGLIPTTIREFSKLKIDQTKVVSSISFLNFIIFDGKLNQKTTELLLSAIDDTKTLELFNGEKL